MKKYRTKKTYIYRQDTEGGNLMKNTKRLVTAALAALMLTTAAAVPAGAEGSITAAQPEGAFVYVEGVPAPKITKVTKGSSKIKLTWTKVKKATGYKLYLKKGSGKYKCIKTIKSKTKVSCKLEGFNSNTRYVFKVRAYKKGKKKTYYSKYSAAKAATTKYGVGAENYTNKYFTIGRISKGYEFVSQVCRPDLNKVKYRFPYQEEDSAEKCVDYFGIKAVRVDDSQTGRTRDDFVKDFIDGHSEDEYPYEKIGYREIDGEEFVVAGCLDESSDYFYRKVFIGLKGDQVYYITYDHPIDSGRESQMSSMLDTVKLTPEGK